jgi:hypothetical protein
MLVSVIFKEAYGMAVIRAILFTLSLFVAIGFSCVGMSAESRGGGLGLIAGAIALFTAAYIICREPGGAEGPEEEEDTDSPEEKS